MARTPTLYDATGNPIRKSDITGGEQGGPDVTGVRSYGSLLPASAPSPAQLAGILKAAAAGDLLSQARLFEDMEEKDVHIFSEMSTRRRAVAGLDYQILPADDSKEAFEIASYVSDALSHLSDDQNDIAEITSVNSLVYALSDAIGKGISCAEIIWELRGKEYRIKSIRHRPLQFFQYHPKRPNELRLRNNTFEGEELIPGKWIVHVHPAKSGSPYRGALFRILAWLYIFRNYSLKAWVQFIESYGIPIRIGKYPPGTSQEEQDLLLRAISNIASDAAIIIPEGMSVDVINVVKTAGGNPHQALLEWSAREISKAILGSPMTEDTGGSYAKAYVLNNVRIDILKSDASIIAGTITRQFIRPIVALNFGTSAPVPSFVFDIPRPDDRKTDAEILKTLVEAGFTDIPVWWIRERFNIPAPADGDVTLRDSLTGNVPTQRALNVKTQQDDITHISSFQNSIDEMLQHIPGIDKASEALLRPLIDFIRSASSYDEISTRLAELYSELSGEELMKLIEKAVFIADLFGRISADVEHSS